MVRKSTRSFVCPAEFALEVLGGKWKSTILCRLGEGPLRYTQLRRLAPRLSDKMLTERLRELMEQGLVVKREELNGRRATLYVLTPRGESLSQLLLGLCEWGVSYAPEFGVAIVNHRVDTTRAQ